MDILMTFPGDIDSKYILVCGYSSILFFWLQKIPFLALFKCKNGCDHIDMLMMFPW